MSAAVLREAAALMRERADAATSGPWLSFHHNERPDEAVVTYDADLSLALCADGDEPEFTDGDARHIASWHPVVALAVADWLDNQAGQYEHYESLWNESHKDPRNRWAERGLTVEANLAHQFKDALAVAGAYLSDST